MKKSLLIAVMSVVGVAAFGTYLSVTQGWQNHGIAWLNLLVRWAHITIGIGWIGASFYFIFLENSLNRSKGLRDELAGNLWAVHGGGFYYLEKYKVAPKQLPEKLHWFKYEAYFTWITGMLLLAIVYYAQAETFLIDKNVAAISSLSAISISLGSLAFAWLIYDGLCKSALVEKRLLFGILGFFLSVVMAWFYTSVFSGRAAYIHVGAMIGTLMAANVFFVIIPSQKALVKAAESGQLLDPRLGQHAGLRSLHNNYMTLPVLFIMISNHFPSTYNHQWNWAVLAGISLASIAVRHYINVREKGKDLAWLLPVAAISILAMAIVTSPKPIEVSADETVSFAEVEMIIQKRCVSCHAENPTDDVWKTAPKGVKLDSRELITANMDAIRRVSVDTPFMPLANKTNMSEEERRKLGVWITKYREKQ